MIYRCRNYGHQFKALIDANNPTKPVICPLCLQKDYEQRFAALPLAESMAKWPIPTIGPST